MHVYLSGPILGCKKRIYKAWRENVIDELSVLNVYSFIDPTVGEIYDVEADHADEVVKNAIDSVNNADIIFAYIPFYSMGTSFEVFLGNQLKKEVIICLEAEHESAFARKFSDHIFYNLDDAINFLKNKVVER